jgi:hypothetical protein
MSGVQCKTYYSEWDAPGARVEEVLKRFVHLPCSGCLFHLYQEDRAIKIYSFFHESRQRAIVSVQSVSVTFV